MTSFNKTLRASKANWASNAWQVSQTMQVYLAGAGGPVQADSTVLSYLSLVRSCYDT